MPIAQNLLDYVQKSRADGVSDEIIRGELIKAGWNPADIDLAIASTFSVDNYSATKSPYQRPSSEVNVPKSISSVHGKSPKKIIISLVIFVLLVLSTGVYFALPKIKDYISNEKGMVTNNGSSIGSASEGTVPVREYTTQYISAENKPSTLRFQFYGPAKIQGYDIKGNLVTMDTKFSPCLGKACSQNSKLRLDILPQPQTGDYNKPIASISLQNVYDEYQKYVAGGKAGLFKSSVISVPLPTPPPKGFTTDTSGWDYWAGVIYYDNDGDQINNTLGSKDWTIGSTDGMVYFRGNEINIANSFVPGWNFQITTNSKLASEKMSEYQNNQQAIYSFRKSFENQIALIPILTSDGQLLFPEPPGSKENQQVSNPAKGIAEINFIKGAPESEITKVKELIQSQSWVSSVVYTSPDQVLEKYKKENAGDPYVSKLETTGENPFGAKLIVTLKSVSDNAMAADYLGKIDFKGNVDFFKVE